MLAYLSILRPDFTAGSPAFISTVPGKNIHLSRGPVILFHGHPVWSACSGEWWQVDREYSPGGAVMRNLKVYGLILSIFFIVVACDHNRDGSNSVGAIGAARPVEAGSIADARFGGKLTLDGPELMEAVLKLLNLDNFGAGGTVTDRIAITSTAGTQGDVTVALLNDFDIFFIG